METLLVVENYESEKNYVNALDDNDVYLVRLDDDEADGSAFSDSVVRSTISEDWNLEQVGSVSLPIYRASRKGE